MTEQHGGSALHEDQLTTTLLSALIVMALIILPQICCPWNFYKPHED